MKGDFEVIIPTLNEANAIGSVLDELLSMGISRDKILVVDGGSTDGTLDIVRSKNIRYVIQDGKGKADAIRTALRHSRGSILVFMDGDYTYPAKYVSVLVDLVMNNNCDLVIGKRMLNRNNSSWIYILGNKILTSFFNLLFGSSLKDALSGMYAARKEYLEEVLFEMPGFSVESEIVAHFIISGYNVCESPIEYRRRIGEKKLRVKTGLSIALNMIKLAWRYNPVFIIFTLASLLAIPGLIIIGYVLYYYLFYGIKYYVKAILGLILFLTGFQSFLLSIISLYMKRMELRLRRRIDRALKKTLKG